MTLHAGVAGWLLGPASGANRRLLALLRAMGLQLGPGERITVLHGAGFAPPALHEAIAWQAVAIPPGPTLRRALAERSILPRRIRDLGCNVFDHALLPAPLVPCPLLLTLHDLRQVDGHGRWPRWLARRVLARSCRAAAAVVVPSRFTQQRLELATAGLRCHVVPGGVDLPADAAPAQPRGFVLHVGHLEPRKNVAVLLRALAALPAQQRPELHCVGADAGAGRALRRLAHRLGVAAFVHWHGAVSEQRLLQCYRQARLVVAPARYEGFGLAVLEALAHGRRVVAAAAGALPELLPDDPAAGCAALPPDDVAAWARAMAATVAEDAEAVAARRRQAARFPWSRPAAQLLELWRELALTPSTAR